MQAPDVRKHLLAVSRALQPLGVRWYVFGAQAVIAAGAVRQTADIDITTDDVPVEKLQHALAKAGFVLREGIGGIEELIKHHRILPLQHRRDGLQLDVVRAGPGPEEGMLERAIFRRIGRTKVPYIETNDLLVVKTLAGREKDLEDIRALLRSKSPEIDVAVVRQRLSELGALIDDSTLVELFDRQQAASKR